MKSTNSFLIDNHRSACLCDAGAADYIAAVVITPTGDEALWLVSREELNSDHQEHGDADQPHEKLGRLPGNMRERIWREAIRCGQPRYNGQPCRHRVKEPGQMCRRHAAEAAT